ncbi:MAG: glycosyltransferase family 4 protein [Paracoccaceae bacterium]
MPDRTPIRIGYVLKRFPRFSETFILNELLTHQARGAELRVFSLLTPPDEPRHARLADLRAPVHYLAKPPAIPAPRIAPADAALFAGNDDKAITTLHAKAAEVARLAGEAGITHLHAHFASDAATVALLAGRIIGGSFSFTAHARDIYHTYVTPEVDDAKRRAKLREAAFTITVSDFNARHLRTLCPEAAHRIHRLYNGIDLSLFAPPLASATVPGRILAVGRLVEKKGFPLLVDACALLRDRGVSFECRIVGDGPQQAELSERIAAARLTGLVHLDGPMPQERLAGLMDSAAIAALPCIVTADGDRDGLPTVLLEAMAKGLPVVTTTVTGGPEIVDGGRTGLLCPPGDVVALADALQRLLVDPAHARAMGRAGRIRAERLFSLSENAGALLDRFTSTMKLGVA